MSGYASAALFAKLGGAGAFLRSRSARLLIPLVAGIIVVGIPVQPDRVGDPAWLCAWFRLTSWVHDYFRFGTLDGDRAKPTWQHSWVRRLSVRLHAARGRSGVLVPERARTKIADGAARLFGGWGLLIAPLAIWPAILSPFPAYRDARAGRRRAEPSPHQALLYRLATSRAAGAESVARCWPAAAALAVAAYGYIASAMWSAPDEGLALAGNRDDLYGRAAGAGLGDDRRAGRDCRPLYEPRPPVARHARRGGVPYIIHQTIIVVVGWWLLQRQVAALPAFLDPRRGDGRGCWAFISADGGSTGCGR